MDFVWNSKDSTKLLRNSCNLQISNDYHLGYHLEHNLTQLQSLLAQFVYKAPTGGDYFLKTNLINKYLILGCNHRLLDWSVHSCEVLYDLDNKLKGFGGFPLTISCAGLHEISPDVAIKTKVNFSDSIGFDFSWIQRFDKNIRFAFSHFFNVTNFLNEPAKTNFNFGAMLEYTIL